MERRKVLTLMVHGVSAAVTFVVGVPTLIYALAPSRGRASQPQWRSVGPIDDFQIGEHHPAAIQPSPESASMGAIPRGVYVWRVSEQEVVVFSRSCTDLGCPVTFDDGSACFYCPCHGGIFDHQGRQMHQVLAFQDTAEPGRGSG